MQRITVLIADDSAAVRDGLRSILARHDDVEVVGAAADGAEAVRLVADLAPRVVLMDAQMPVMDGARATRLIKAADAHTRVLFLTVHEGYLERGLEAGADAALLKDVDRAELLATLRRLARTEHGEE